MRYKLIYVFLYAYCISAEAQQSMVFNRAFTKKIQRYGIEFYQPVERWLKLTNKKNNAYIKHDVILHSPPNVEIRIKIHPQQPRSEILHPQVLIATTLSSIATNDQSAVIKIAPLDSIQSQLRYGADLAIVSDFIPKQGYSPYPSGKMLSLYKDNIAIIHYIILYEGSLDPYFELPLRFKD